MNDLLTKTPYTHTIQFGKLTNTINIIYVINKSLFNLFSSKKNKICSLGCKQWKALKWYKPRLFENSYPFP